MSFKWRLNIAMHVNRYSVGLLTFGSFHYAVCDVLKYQSDSQLIGSWIVENPLNKCDFRQWIQVAQTNGQVQRQTTIYTTHTHTHRRTKTKTTTTNKNQKQQQINHSAEDLLYLSVCELRGFIYLHNLYRERESLAEVWWWMGDSNDPAPSTDTKGASELCSV